MPLDNDSVWRRDHDHVFHPWTQFSSFAEHGSMVVAKADGIHLEDDKGRRYLDGIGGIWCVNVGYGRREIAEAMAEQAMTLPFVNSFCDSTCQPAADLAWKLASLSPGRLDRVFFVTGGSTANDTAVRTAHYYHHQRGEPQRRHVLTRWDAYHGSTYLTASLSGKRSERKGFRFEDGWVHHLSSPNLYRRPDGLDEAGFLDLLAEEMVATIERLGPEKVACFIAEPLMGAGGVVVPPAGYHARMLEICRRYGVLYISDEVVTGFGRLGHMFASEDAFGIVPDMITTAKGLTSGYAPLGATLVSEAVYDVLASGDDGEMFCHGFTYSGHPVACAAGLASIAIIEREDLCGHVRDVGPYFSERLASLGALSLVGDVRGSHFMQCVEFVANRAEKRRFDEAVDIGTRVANRAQDHGLIVRPIGALNVLSPPLTLDRDDVDFVVDTLERTIREVADDLTREGIAFE